MAILCFYKDDDFNTTPLIATIPAEATNTTVRVAVTNDDIVEGDEMFSMSLNVPSSLGPGVVAGSVTSATGIIIDSSSMTSIFTSIYELLYYNYRYHGKISTKTIHWFRSYRICDGNIGTSWRNIQ